MLLLCNSQAFEAAGIPPGKIFSMNADIDKIKQSKYFCALIQQSSKGNSNEFVCFNTLSFFAIFLLLVTQVYLAGFS